jgi:hypothetical protein
MRSLVFFNLPNPSSRTMTLGSTQPLTEMSTWNLPGGVKGGWRNLTAICELIVQKMWELPWPVTGIALPFFMHFQTHSEEYLSSPILVHI